MTFNSEKKQSDTMSERVMDRIDNGPQQIYNIFIMKDDGQKQL